MFHSSRQLSPKQPSPQSGRKNAVSHSRISPSPSARKSTRDLVVVRDPLIIPTRKISPAKTFKIPAPSAKQSAPIVSQPKPVPNASSRSAAPVPPTSNATRKDHRSLPDASVTPSHKPSLRRLHPPDYDWDRHGRARELRIRTLARKFFAIWLTRVYGRVSPALARQYHNRRLIIQMLGEWYSRSPLEDILFWDSI